MENENKPKLGWQRLEALSHLRKWGPERYRGFKWKMQELIKMLPDGEPIKHFPKLMENQDLADYYADWTKADFEWLLSELEKKEKEAE